MIYFVIGSLIMLVPGALVGWRAPREFGHRGRLSPMTAGLGMFAFVGQVMTTLLAAAVGAMPMDVPMVPAVIVGVLVAASGAAMHLVARAQFKSFKLAWGLSTERLITHGIYRVSRNPQVVGWFLVELGAGIAGRSLAAVALSVVFMIAFAAFLPVEEHMLEARFGEEYRRYRARVPRFLLRWPAVPEGGLRGGSPERA